MHTVEHDDLAPDAIEQKVRLILAEHLEGVPLRNLQVSAGVDHDGDEVLYIDAFFGLSDPLDATRFYNLTSLVREALLAHGETRFPHLRYHFDERQKVAGWS